MRGGGIGSFSDVYSSQQEQLALAIEHWAGAKKATRCLLVRP